MQETRSIGIFIGLLQFLNILISTYFCDVAPVITLVDHWCSFDVTIVFALDFVERKRTDHALLVSLR